ncbi:hypothetical protein DUNSADRAFT_1931 [Dunaliella salina]|uniref:Encoded protein n=1 Tax=Dunaliella salina TaxID=3046 RepID=A0ABQ7FWW9_DUNSA|nr:hypothetical protein DUNSADRAFT_1931 [Dunaliella salina]|eukprot:KAF5826825.1 hypothetical protein DUNSADRAFT_1931 [Dunaliella salina]
MSRRESSAGDKPPSGASGSNKAPDRPSKQWNGPGPPPMQRMSSLNRRGGGGVRSSRRSSRRSQLGTTGEGQQRKLEVCMPLKRIA